MREGVMMRVCDSNQEILKQVQDDTVITGGVIGLGDPETSSG
jgi:hypothetical protein